MPQYQPAHMLLDNLRDWWSHFGDHRAHECADQWIDSLSNTALLEKFAWFEEPEAQPTQTPDKPNPDEERFPDYIDLIVGSGLEGVRRELDRLAGKLVDAQELSNSSSPIGRILFR